MLRYPLTLDENENDYVVFRHFPYTPNNPDKFGFKSSDAAPPGEADSPGIILYMPNSTPPASNENNWESSGNKFMGPLNHTIAGAAAKLGGTAANAIANPTSLQSALEEGAEVAGKTIADVGKNAAGGIGQLTARLAAGAATALGVDMNENNIMQLNRGFIFNPNVELLYNGPSMRGFSFTFMFVAKSAEESNVVDNIILEFKRWSSPESSEQSGGVLNIPHLWQVQYKGLASKKMNKFKKSALVNVVTQDNQGYKHHATFDDGTPIVTTMTLSFMEVDIVTRQDHVDVGGRGY